ncbi:flavin reductase family protein [Trinickia caryophylli]|uniref:NADH-FMN oxidoreductase RutF, flavin reductase (DIM6/NTAB) family n=1 Tax=Trinickia caryophylli TaxID=28094 RepID=A0A1X7EVK3_TRICW|nr:flavin reductase family protein [Trinickia caryophylli]PMS12220.1 flavin reductase family protein [Trinickia caryophylli]TRX18502.1 flavin reductase family protein [Trinickia caryophylli]WQE10709.1 flavin reductase family protein [Trinickia caryophylli]SMF40667.1 NADH-FMN oxidoreductase RutF, flavin reductase (DIM6/NTAB) family [Trinickia caryophylli]GLU33081.1 hypothetical protein Busp01_29230 [Trinickia caryophylli]
MSPFAAVALEHASRLINHGPTVLVTTAHEGRRNIMAAAWSMPVEFVPPRIAIVIDKRTFTRELMAASGTFAIGIPCVASIDLTYAVGNCSGKDVDKFARFEIETSTSPVLGLPLPEADCVAWMECRLIREPHTEDAYDTCFGEVVGAAADTRVFNHGRWKFDDANAPLHTIHHLGGGNFAAASATISAQPR